MKSVSDILQNFNERHEEIIEATEIRIKYKGYIEREKMVAEKMHRLENIKIKGKFNYAEMHQLSTEARQKLEAINPETLAQASRSTPLGYCSRSCKNQPRRQACPPQRRLHDSRPAHRGT